MDDPVGASLALEDDALASTDAATTATSRGSRGCLAAGAADAANALPPGPQGAHQCTRMGVGQIVRQRLRSQQFRKIVLVKLV